MLKSLLVTGGAGFIGSAFVAAALDKGYRVTNLDKLSYAGNLQNLEPIASHANYRFVKGAIGDRGLMIQLLQDMKVDGVVNFAAESHVDRSISGPIAFIETNVLETAHLLEATREYLGTRESPSFRFLHVSTDEVFGTLAVGAPAFTEEHPFEPNSPYAASKASSDHLVRAYCNTYGFPAVTTHCSNNFGPRQFPEKLIPLVIRNALLGAELPIYGDGRQVRDWLYVEDHCSALLGVLERGRLGTTYNIGGGNEIENLTVVKSICAVLDEELPRSGGGRYEDQIRFVVDRPGHDRRYAINSTKIESELGWEPLETFESGMRKTVKWYLEHQDWVRAVTSGEYRNWINTQYQGRSTIDV